MCVRRSSAIKLVYEVSFTYGILSVLTWALYAKQKAGQVKVDLIFDKTALGHCIIIGKNFH